MSTLHIVCGLPASGKTTFAKKLSSELHATFLDSDTATDLMIQAAHIAAGIDPHDRDSALYKATYRVPVYNTLYALANDNLPHSDVVIAGPFTSEILDTEKWKKNLESQFSPHKVVIHQQKISESERLKRMQARGALRDAAKLIHPPLD